MRKPFYYFVLLFVALDMLHVSMAMGWNDKITHKDLSRVAANKSVLSSNNSDYLKTIGFEKGLIEILHFPNQKCGDDIEESECRAIDWIEYGAEKEDADKYLPLVDLSIRPLNHFHEPIKNQKLDVPLFDNESALEWAQDSAAQSSEVEGDQSWPTLRTLYHEALIELDKTTKDQMFAQLFKGLGHQMHLVQDMAVPYHVRNDAHLADALQGEKWYNPLRYIVRKDPLYFENWAKSERGKIIDMASDNTVFPTLDFDAAFADTNDGPATSPISQLWDAEIYDGTNPSISSAQGLSEYTNANFYSEHTLFAAESLDESDPHYFPHPRQVDTNLIDIADLRPEQVVARDGNLDLNLYLQKLDQSGAVEIDHFVRVGYFSSKLTHGPNPDLYIYSRSFFLDEACHEDYAEKLVPRAVGYSAALLNYFFRGQMETQHFTAKHGAGFAISGVQLDVRNASASLTPGQSVEPMEAGQLGLVYRYFDPVNDQWAGDVVTGVYAVAAADDPINFDFVSLDVDFSTPIPFGAEKISFTLVYLGKLGDENDAVIGARVNTNIPSRIAYEHQPGGAPNASDIHIVLPDGRDDRTVTASNGIDRWYFGPDWHPDGQQPFLAYEYQSCVICDDTDLKQVIALHDLTSDEPPLLLKDFVTVDDPPDNYSGEDWGDVMLGPSFSPDGGKLCAINWAFGPLIDAIAVIDGTEGAQWHWINNYNFWLRKSLRGSAPAWSPTRDEIAFFIHEQSDSEGVPLEEVNDLYLISADGSTYTRLTNDEYTNTKPAWSPDGQWIAFVSNRDGGDAFDLWVMDRMGEQMVKLLDCPVPGCDHPSFSPNGLEIAFVRDNNIYVMALTDQTQVQITHHGNLTNSPNWSPVLALPEVTLTASAETVASGAAVTLTWQVNNADSAELDQGLGPLDPDSSIPNGSIVVNPAATTTYTLTALGLGGYAEASVTIVVK